MPVGSIKLPIVHVFQYNARHQHAQQQEQKEWWVEDKSKTVRTAGTGQAEPAVGVGSQALQTPMDEYGKYSRELGGLSDGGINHTKLSSSVVWGKEPCKH